MADGVWDDQFPIDVFQTGSGTSSNMNMNEVLATLASEKLGEPGAVHPNDHVNASQSSNDVFPTAIHIAVAEAVLHDLIPALEVLKASLRKKSREFAKVVKSGRTHLMDATPVTLGQEFGGYAQQIEAAIGGSKKRCRAWPRCRLGGTAVGTGINAPKTFAPRVIKGLAERLELPLTEAKDHFAAQGCTDALVEASGELRTAAVALVKIANDIRWMGSGPRTGLAEIFIPDLQPGSSIMPGKVNPVMAEAVTQVSAQVIGNDAAVAFGGIAGQLRAQRVHADDGAEPARVHPAADNVSRLFATTCVDGIRANVGAAKQYAEVVAVDRHRAQSPTSGTSAPPRSSRSRRRPGGAFASSCSRPG